MLQTNDKDYHLRPAEDAGFELPMNFFLGLVSGQQALFTETHLLLPEDLLSPFLSKVPRIPVLFPQSMCCDVSHCPSIIILYTLYINLVCQHCWKLTSRHGNIKTVVRRVV